MTIHSIRECPLQDPMIDSTHSLDENRSNQAIHEIFDRIFGIIEGFERSTRQNPTIEENARILVLQDPTISSTSN